MSRTLAVLALGVALSAAQVFAAPPGAPDLAPSFTLPNGLEVYVVESRSTPLVRVELAFRSGAIVQTAENSGVIHLHEHMMFEGCERFPSSTLLFAERAAMGVSDWNAFTSDESVRFHCVVPSADLGRALRYWAAVFEAPRFDPAILATAKETILNEIGAGSSPSYNDAFYAAAPWRMDVRGFPAAIKAATPESLRKIHETFYVPNNASLFITGGVGEGPALRAEVEAAFGDWKRAPDPWAQPIAPAFRFPALPSPLFFAERNPSIQRWQRAETLSFRGADFREDGAASSDPAAAPPRDAAVATLLSLLLADPSGAFQAGFEKAFGAGSSCDPSFTIKKDGSVFSFTACAPSSPGAPGREKAGEGVRGQIRKQLAELCADPAAYFGESALEEAKARYADDRLTEKDMPLNEPAAVREWATLGAPMHESDIRAVDYGRIGAFAKKWLLDNVEELILALSPDDYDAEQLSGGLDGYREYSSLTSWWRHK